MLTHLSLKDFVIVKELSVELAEGLTVLTGETGAGKSILIDALQLVLGARADTGVIREGATSTEITAIFEVNPKTALYLREQAMMGDEDLLESSVIIRRIIDKNGRSRAWINGVAAGASQLRELGEQLLDIHGQNAQQSLLKPQGQLALLDEYGCYRKELAAVKSTYSTWQNAVVVLQKAKDEAAKLADEAERLSWVHEELSAIAPQKDEWETLNAEHKRLGNAHDIIESVDGAVYDLSRANNSALDTLSRHASRLEDLAEYDEKLGEIAAQFSEAQAILQDAVRDLEHYRDRTDLDESRFEEVDERVSLYFNAARKFHVLPEELYLKLAETTEKLKTLQDGLDLEALSKEEKRAHSAYLKAAQALSKKRWAAADELSRKVTEAMQGLAMKGGSFNVALHETQPTGWGLERCEFEVAGHTGVQRRALAKVASGGELSRISLAIAVITSNATPVDTLIFDEVDAGIGGSVADVVGKLLKTLAQDRQVMCVTHLPQVASYGTHHWHVYKVDEKGATVSRMKSLDTKERVNELARMLSGSAVTEKGRASAAELLERASNFRP